MFKQSNLTFHGTEPSAAWSLLFDEADGLLSNAVDAAEPRDFFLTALDFWDLACQKLNNDTRYSPEEMYCIKQTFLKSMLDKYHADFDANFQNRILVRAYFVARHTPASALLSDVGFFEQVFPASPRIKAHLIAIQEFYTHQIAEPPAVEAMAALSLDDPDKGLPPFETAMAADDSETMPVADAEMPACPIQNGSYRVTYAIPSASEGTKVFPLFQSFLSDATFDIKLLAIGDFDEQTLKSKCDNKMFHTGVNAKGRGLHIAHDLNAVSDLKHWLDQCGIAYAVPCFVFINKNKVAKEHLKKADISNSTVLHAITRTLKD